ncbi:glycosyltransferase [Luteimonas sp. MC1828]|uniref:glycosyltransferase family 4 protein n=1 Tax=Luteimonas sp. MC1828 TaxID=2799787 RepID=UPI0018F10EA6|nr:glycosyltransferase [Luteimonas sp. MC1828]MBJ7574393.1 glycosyltransferase [Luteimonas sp. MC1828]
MWTTNIVLPSVANDFGLPITPFGGWLQSLLSSLAAHQGLRLGVAMRANVKSHRKLVRDGVEYHVFPSSILNRHDIDPVVCARILEDFSPDILHAHGSEMASTARFMSMWNGPKVLSLQGILSGILPMLEGGGTIRAASLADIVMIAMLRAKSRFVFTPRVAAENICLRRAHVVLGRTAWDRAYSRAVNSDAHYVQCGEMLREEFFAKRWTNVGKLPHTLFMGNASVPLKGAHIALRALAVLKRTYPSVLLKIAGPSISSANPSAWATYLGYLRRLISSMGLDGNVEFLGVLNPEDMANHMVRAHVYLLPSLIENSPNTLGEAMWMGIPSVCSFVGGVPSVAAHEKEALFYSATDHMMLAEQISRLFDNDGLCDELSSHARTRAIQNHDEALIVGTVFDAYRSLSISRIDT